MSAAKALNSEMSPHAAPDTHPPDPSMEDILASIRRIIADDQSRHTSAAATRRPTPQNAPAASVAPAPVARTPAASMPAASMSPPRPVAHGAPAGRIEASPPRPPVARAAQRPTAAPVPQDMVAATASGGAPIVVASAPGTALNGATPHLNAPPIAATMFDRALIDEIASAGVASALQQSTPRVAPAEPAAVAPVADPVRAEPASTEAVRPEPRPDPPAVTPIPEVFVPTAPQAPPPMPANLAAAAPVVPAVAPPPAPPAPAEVPAAPPKASVPVAMIAQTPESIEALVSELADASIESSFQALATSVFMQNTGVMEGMVRDMLRPLLKSWLEDNLPTIVERLVRTEIERVARGGRA